MRLIQLELILVKGIRSVSRLILFHMDIQSFQYLIEKDYLFSPKMLIFLCQRSVDSICVGICLGSLSIRLPVHPFANTIL